MIVIGVAGGIASGKSIVCRVFESLGGMVINADHVGHETLDMPQVKEALVQAFGSGILGLDSKIIRPALGKIVFSDPASRVRLDAIVHPPLVGEIHRRIQVQRDAGLDGVVVVDAALIVEWDEVDMVDTLVIVTAPRAMRISWLMVRNKLSEQEATQRIASQLSDEDRLRWADHVIENNGTLADLEAKASDVWHKIAGPG